MTNKEGVQDFPLFNGFSFFSFHNMIFDFLKLEISVFVKELANIHASSSQGESRAKIWYQ